MKLLINNKKIKETKFYWNKFIKNQFKIKSHDTSEKYFKLMKIMNIKSNIKQNQINLENSLLKWKLNIINKKNKFNDELLILYKNIEVDFSTKLTQLEKSYEDSIQKILKRNKELELIQKIKDKEIENMKVTLEESSKILNIKETTSTNNNEMEILKNKIDFIHEKYDNELHNLKSENESLREFYNEYQKNYQEFEQIVIDKNQIAEVEKKLTLIKCHNEKLKLELNDINSKYEN